MTGPDPWEDIDPEIVAAIRRDERRQLADLLEHHAATISSFSGGTGSTVHLIAFMLQLDRT